MPDAGTPPARRSLKHDVGMMLVGRTTYLACQGASLIALARLGTPSDVGMYSLGLAVSAPVLQFFSLNLRNVQATDAGGEFSYPTYARLRNVTCVLAIAVSTAVAIAAGYAGATLATVCLLTVAKAIESQSDVIFGLWQLKDRYTWLARAMALKGVAMLGGVVAGFLASGSVVGAALGTVVGWTLVFLLHDLPLARSLVEPDDHASNDAAKALAWRALPMGYTLMLTALHANVPRYAVEWSHGAALLGYFAATGYLVVATNTLVSTLANAVLPRLSDRLAGGESGGFSVLLRKTQVLAALAGVGTILLAAVAGDLLLGLLFGADYAAYRWLLVAQATVAFLGGQATLVGNGLVATRRFSALVVPSTLAIAVNILGCVLLVPPYDVYGAAAAAFMAGMTLLLGRTWVLRRVLER